MSSCSFRSRKLNSLSACSAIVEISMRDETLAPRAGALAWHGKGEGTQGNVCFATAACPKATADALRQAAGSGRHRLAAREGGRLGRAPGAFGARGAAELRAVAAREVRRGLKAAGRSDIDDRHRGLQ